MTLQDTFRLPALHAFVSEARRCVVARLREWGAHEDVCGDAELVISELFTNAVLHTDSVEIGYGLRVTGMHLRVEVADEGCRSKEQRLRSAECEEENGRGLLLVKAFSETWGVRARENGQGSVTWADLPYRPAPGRTPQPQPDHHTR
ncbi:ATP-binding protein [Streptomyces marispadix]|uniref:ATP-binding protein n=1 Tax=Streptomyces marispadix TaxID=2922868 RepID=A0ABS9T258_9ACTN|nr:ATP-binding protein [Streptomyces marispadix]MCH6162594.1 ATP-binding protein [Streptomyces marispadix]